MRGTVIHYDSDWGVGSIQPASGGEPICVRVGAIERSNLPALLAGQTVDFNTLLIGGRECAVDLILR